jgi:hypothetical protein
MAVITGKDGAISLGGGAVNGKVRSWTLNYTSTNVDASGAGDVVDELVHLRKNWVISGEFLALNQADWDLDLSLVGTAAAVALKRIAADTNPFATGTGLVTQMQVTHGYDQPTTVTFEVRSTGTDLTFDTTPA